MHREIKFRAWDVEMQCMVSWDELERDWEQEGYYSSVFDVRERHHWIPMQYTGLLDKNGTEIYEGDVLDEKYKLLVAWKIDRWCVVGRAGTMLSLYEYIEIAKKAKREFVVIGNIYENAELTQQIEH